MTRRESREHVFRILFRREFFGKDEWRDQAEQYLDLVEESALTDHAEEDGPSDGTKEKAAEKVPSPMTEEERQEILLKSLAVCEAADGLDEEINAAAEGWKTKRMEKVDLTVLRLALYEIRYDEKVPTKVAINEAVELARKFGGDDSPSFVNGVLARLVR